MLQVIANMRSRYRLALLAIAILSSATALLIQSFLAIQKDDGHVINIAGKQRMLSQKIAWHANALIRQDSAEHRKSLQQAVQIFKQGHQFLTKQDESGDFLYLNGLLINYYFSAPDNLASQSEHFFDTAMQLLNSTNYNSVDYAVFNIEQVELFLSKLDHAVSLFEQQSNAKVTLVSNIELGFWLATLCLLLLELKFIFQPMEKHITSTLNKYQQQKQQAELISQNKERFIARASHECRTPLQGLINAVDELDLTASQQVLKQQAYYCSSRLLNIIDELHEAQQLSSGQWRLTPSTDNLLNTLESVIQSYQFAYQQKNILLIKNLSEELNCQVELDHRRLQQVLAELLNNALKFTAAGQVTVSASLPNKQQLLLTVSDTGTGFGLNYPYLSAEPITQNNHFQGMQMGLARVQHILLAQSGSIEFKDLKPNGAAVSLVLPVRVTTQQQSSLANDLHCLVVEDNPLNAMILTGILKDIGYTTELAQNGLLATDKVTSNSYDVIFMDLNMPVMDGFRAIEIIRQELNSTTPIIVVTANTSQADLERAYQLGSDGHVYKPINNETIKKALTDVLNKG